MERNLTPLDALTEREQEILRRLSSGLSDQQIADELFLSLNTIKWYNRQIFSKLGVSSRAQAVAFASELGLLRSGMLTSPTRGRNCNLPAESGPFVGRSVEIAAIKQLLSTSRLVTLTGVGGTGKTRLALRVASEVADDYADGVCFVDLAPLSHAALVPGAIARAFGFAENSEEAQVETLKRALSGQELLMLIDNFEHVIEAAPLVSELLAACPRLKVLATSRESLHLSAEQEYPVPPLSLPVAESATLQSVIASEAGLLFVQRAQMTQPHLVINDNSAPAIARICARLHGLPLAIELAAARCKHLSPQALLERLGKEVDNPFLQTLTGGWRDAPPRQRTLRASIEWSYNLLDEDEKRLFARLAVFQGGRSLEAIEAVCMEGLRSDVLDRLASLVDKNLVQQQEEAGSEPRFVMLEMIHEYARERLLASGEMEAMKRRHAEYFVALAERAEPEMRSAGYDDWCRLFELELDNLRAALEWTLHGGDVTLGVRLASALGMFWYGRGYHVEATRWIQPLMARLAEVPEEYHAPFLITAGHFAWLHDLAAAKDLFLQAREISRRLDDRLHTAWAQAFVGYTMMYEPAAAMPIAEESLEMFRELNHQPGIAQALNIIGEIARFAGDDERARRTYEACIAVCEQTGEARRICYMYNNIAYVDQHEGDHAHAIALCRQALRLARERQYKRDLPETLMTLAGSIAVIGDPAQAVQLLGAAESAMERMGAVSQPSDIPEYERILADLHMQLTSEAFEMAWKEGRRMSLEQAVALALEE